MATVPNSFDYTEPWFPPAEPKKCPHCGQEFQPGQRVHWWQDTLWHTKPCP